MNEHHPHSGHRHPSGRDGERPGMVRRVTRGLSQHFGVSSKLILAGFIIGLIVNLPLTLALFLIALYWVDHPGQLERKLARATDLWRRGWSLFGGDTARTDRETTPFGQDDDLDFTELRRQFDELERRAGDLETHVSSEEFRLRQEFERMKREGGRSV